MNCRLRLILPLLTLFVLFARIATAQVNMLWQTPENGLDYPTFTGEDTLLGEYHRYRSNNDVKHYDLNVTIDPAGKKISGYVIIKTFALEHIREIQLELDDRMEVDSIEVLHSQVALTRTGDIMQLRFDPAIRKGQMIDVKINYHGKPFEAPEEGRGDGIYWRTDNHDNAWIAVKSLNSGAQLWWPVKGHLLDEADSVSMVFRVPEGLQCVSNGVLDLDSADGGMHVYKWKHRYPINSYNLTFNIGKYEHISDTYNGKSGKLNLDYYITEHHVPEDPNYLAQIPVILGVFEEKFGPYPWYRDGFKLIESPVDGIEHQTAIGLKGPFLLDSTGIDYDLVHQIAHEWWGNSVTSSDYADIWIHEGFSTFSEALIAEKLGGQKAYLKYLYGKAFQITNWRPVVGPYKVNYLDANSGDVYFKGALFLHTLRVQIDDDELFFKIIKSFYEKYKYSNASTTNFLQIVNTMTMKDYSKLFHQYLNEREVPQLEYQVEETEGDQSVMLYRFSNLDQDLSLPLEFNIGGKSIVLHPTTEVQIVQIPKNQRIIRNTRQVYVSCLPSESLRELYHGKD